MNTWDRGKMCQAGQEGVQTMKSHGIQNSYYFMYGTQIVRFSFVECKNLLRHLAVVKIYITRVCQNYVRLSVTGRNFLGTCKPLTWLVCGTSTFLIRKKRNSWKVTSNYSRIETDLFLVKYKNKVKLFIHHSSVFKPSNIVIYNSTCVVLHF